MSVWYSFALCATKAAAFTLFRTKHSLARRRRTSQCNVSVILLKLDEPIKYDTSSLGRISHLALTHVTIPIVPCAPWMSLYIEDDEGPAASFCDPPAAHCSSSVPGPAAAPVRNNSPLPNTISAQPIGSPMSQW